MNKSDLITINDAVVWASEYTKKSVTISNISYLIQYALIDKVINNGVAYISQSDLKKYYDKNKKEINWKEKLGNDLNWKLSFDNLKESDTTKHVHRIHPYKGKFIPQLVNYFIDNSIDEFKKEVYFKKDDIILDPFCGSGTTLVQANELGINALGIDISNFNTIISNSKISYIDLGKLVLSSPSSKELMVSSICAHLSIDCIALLTLTLAFCCIPICSIYSLTLS